MEPIARLPTSARSAFTRQLAALAFLLLVVSSTLAAPPDRAVEKELSAYLGAFFQSEPAWGYALVAHEGQILFKRGYGWADWSAGRRNRVKTPFRIQSLSKSFTGIATLMLIERGALGLDDSVIDHVPELAAGDGITVRHLLHMESGVFDLTDDPEALQNASRFHRPEELLQYFAARPLNFPPGTRYQYSNSNYILLGIIIERISGLSFGDFLAANIFAPLRMKRSTFDPLDLAFSGLRAVGYVDLAQRPPEVAEYYHPSAAFAAGGILATAVDLLKWDQALYGERLLSRPILEEAFTPGIGGYGCGWIIDWVRIQGQRQKLVYHTGGGPGFRSGLLRLVDANVTTIILFNTSGPPLPEEGVRLLIPEMAREIGEIVLRPRE